MKKLLALLLSGLCLLLCACGDTSGTKALTEAEITAAVADAGFTCVLSSGDTFQSELKDDSPFDDQFTASYCDPDTQRLVLSVTSTAYEGNRTLSTVFVDPEDSDSFSWSGREAQLSLAETLYGLEAGTLWTALAEQPLPENTADGAATTEFYSWKITFSDGTYCVAMFTRHIRGHALLTVNLLPSAADYEEFRSQT